MLFAEALIKPEAIFMLVTVWAIILTGTGYCFYKLMTSERNLGGDE